MTFLLIRNNVELLTDIKKWLVNQFQMKYLGEVSYALGIQLIKEWKNRLLALFSMQNTKKGNLASRYGVYLFKKQCPKTPQDE